MSRLSKIYNLVDCNKLNQENSRKIKFVKLLARAEFCNERHFDNYFDDKNIYNEFYEAVNYFKDSHSDVDRLLYIKGYLSIYGRININEKKRIVDKIGSYYEDFKNSNLFQDYLLYMVMFYYYLALDAKVENKEKYIVKVYDIYKVSRELDFKYSYQKTLILLFHFTGDIYGELIDDKLNVELELLDSFEDVFYPNLEAYYYQNYANKKYGTWYEDLDEEDFIKYCKFLKGSIYRYSLYDGQRAFYELTKFLLNDISKAVRCFNKESIISSLSDISEFYSKQNNGYPLYDLVISTCEYIEKGKRNFNEEYLTKFIKTFSEKSQST